MPRRLRPRTSSSSDDDDGHHEIKTLGNLLDDIKDSQKSRKRPVGVSVNEMNELLFLASTSTSDSKTDSFKLKHSGLVDLKKMKRADLKDTDVEEGMRQTFSKESHLRDEDEEMRKYVEEELSRRKGRQNQTITSSSTLKADVDEQLFEYPERLKKYQSKKNEEMLSNQMLCGIPEVDLGIDSKIRNIEETEAAKLKLLKEAIDKKKDLQKKLTAHQNLAKDLAKSYIDHNIYKIDETTRIGSDSVRAHRPDRPKTGPIPVVDKDTPKWIDGCGRTVEKPINFK